MKKNVIKMAFAAVCVVAAGMGGMKAYNTANQSEADLLLAENVEALSAGDGGWGAIVKKACGWVGLVWTCYDVIDSIIGNNDESYAGWDTQTVTSKKSDGEVTKVIKTCVHYCPVKVD